MRFQKKLRHAALVAAITALAAGAGAQTIRVANQGDASSMDPHSLNRRCS